MPAYNSSNYISESIQSVLFQSYTNWELLILDDCSTDNTVEIIEKYADKRIRLFRNTCNRGIVNARNELFKKAGGDYIAFLDSDDISDPNRFQVQVDFFLKNPHIAVLGTGVRGFGHRIYESNCALDPNLLFASMIFRNPLCTSSVMLNVGIINVNDLYISIDDYLLSEDFFLWQQLLSKYRGCLISSILTNYRTHLSNTSSDTARIASGEIATLHILLKKNGFIIDFDEVKLLHEFVFLEKIELVNIFRFIIICDKIFKQNKSLNVFDSECLEMLFSIQKDKILNSKLLNTPKKMRFIKYVPILKKSYSVKLSTLFYLKYIVKCLLSFKY